MELKLEEAAYFDFCTHRFDTGAATDADSTPSAEVFEDATDTTVVALTVTKRTSKTGNYRVPVTAAAADGFEVGKTYNVVASATVNSIAGKGVIGCFKVRARGKDDLAYPATSGRSTDIDSSGRVLLQPTQSGVTIPTVTTLTNAPSDSSGVTTLLSRLSSARAGYLDNLSAGAVALEASLQGLITTIGASAAGVATAVWSAATRLLTAGTNIVLAKGTGVTGFNDLSAAQINAEADTAIADAALATAANLAVVAGYLDTEIAAIKLKTDNLPGSPAAVGDIPSASTVAAAVLTAADANPIAANIKEVHDVEITGTGVETTDEWRPV